MHHIITVYADFSIVFMSGCGRVHNGSRTRSKQKETPSKAGWVGRLKNELGLCKFEEADKTLFRLYITVNCKTCPVK